VSNPNDPMLKSGPAKQKALFDAMVNTCHGQSSDVVAGAAVNLLINAIRQAEPNRAMAERAIDEMFGRAKSLLFEHYDSVTGKRRSVFPFTQVIEMPHLIDKDRLRH
jgi:hypothetical protein